MALLAGGAFVLAGAASALVPDDPDASHWSYLALNLLGAWELTTGSPDVVIAVVDSGVDAGHPELAGAIQPGYDFVAQRPGAAPVDGHGTAVAAAAAGRAGNGLGGLGACPECSVLPLQVVGSDGIALNGNIAAAIDYAVDHRAAVVNVSLIGPNSPQRLRDALVRARAAGVLVVAAAGNDGNERPLFPAAFEEATSVGAVTPEGTLATWSSRGAWVDFAAPECTPVAVLGDGTGIGCGTSVSAPLISGIVGLLRTQAPFAHVSSVEGSLFITARTRPVSSIANGVPDAAEALQRLGSPEPILEPVILGEPAVGRVLEAFSGIWVGAPTVMTYQWERCRKRECSPIAGATEPRIELGRTEAGDRIRVSITMEAVTTRTSLQTAPVALAPRLLEPPTIVGRARVGARLLARRGAWEGSSLRYSTVWLHCRKECAFVADGSTYRIRPRDRGSRIRVDVTATNSLGAVTASSKPTRVVR